MLQRLSAFWSSDHSLSALLWVLGFSLFVLVPSLALLGAPEWEQLILASFFTLLVLSGIIAAWGAPEMRRLVLVAAAIPLILFWIEFAYHPPFVKLLAGGVRLGMVGILGAVLFGRVVAPGPVTKARLKGAIAVYLLIGVFFEELFRALCIAFPDALSVHGSNAPSIRYTAELLYFSFSTLTTAGYGDIVPVHPLARSVANFEAITGQLYIVLLIGRLLSLHLAQAGERLEAADDQRATSPRKPYREG